MDHEDPPVVCGPGGSPARLRYNPGCLTNDLSLFLKKNNLEKNINDGNSNMMTRN